jgi:hypothetical protein
MQNANTTGFDADRWTALGLSPHASLIASFAFRILNFAA